MHISAETPSGGFQMQLSHILAGNKMPFSGTGRFVSAHSRQTTSPHIRQFVIERHFCFSPLPVRDQL